MSYWRHSKTRITKRIYLNCASTIGHQKYQSRETIPFMSSFWRKIVFSAGREPRGGGGRVEPRHGCRCLHQVFFVDYLEGGRGCFEGPSPPFHLRLSQCLPGGFHRVQNVQISEIKCTAVRYGNKPLPVYKGSYSGVAFLLSLSPSEENKICNCSLLPSSLVFFFPELIIVCFPYIATI